MRILRFFLAHAALALLVLSCAGFAASNPLRSPRGLALDASGNLYVANTDGNNILVFSPSYSQLRSKTITAGINAPTSLVFDSLGNLWVANSGASNGGANGSISQYTAGVQNAGATITDGIDNPFSIAMDGIGNLFVENNYANVTVYEPQSAFSPPRFPFVFYSAAEETLFFGVLASSQGVVFVGTSGYFEDTPQTVYGMELNFIYGQNLRETVDGEALALTSDASANVYLANADGTVDKLLADGGVQSTVLEASFPITGIAVDSKRGRIYLSDYDDSQIAVYSLTGTLLKVIQ
ncbi:MAG: hypothetical protein WCF68_12410 [Terriglobales bacterium]